MGSKDIKNSAWGEKWMFLNINKILKILSQRKSVKSKSTNSLYVKLLSYGAAPASLFVGARVVILSLIVQKSCANGIKKKMLVNVSSSGFESKIKTSSFKIYEIPQLLTLQKIFNLK